jgi:hypothetical protein
VFVPDHPRETRRCELSDQVAELASHINAATGRWLRLLAELDELGCQDGYKTLPHWLSWRCGMTLATARDHVRVAQRLRTRPLVAAALERGEISYSKVRALMRLEDDFDEKLMLSYALHASASQIETIVRGCRRCVAVDEGAERQFAERSFAWSYDDEGGVVFRGRLPAEQGALVVRALEAARDEIGPPPKEVAEGQPWDLAELTTSPAARRADAFVAVAQSALAERVSSADVYQVVVHVDVDALRADAPDGRDCRLEDGSPLPPEIARRLACDASLVRVLESDGKTISVGRKTRTIAPAQRRALALRDKGCAFPGCCQRRHVDAHHIEHWADGGETNLDNLVQLCRYHHGLVHKGLFKIRREADGACTFLRANGAVVPQAPRQPRGDCASLKSANADRELRTTPWALFPKEANPSADLGWSVTSLLDSRRTMRE